jgi:hypothetical protein
MSATVIKALVAARKEMGGAKKDSTNPAFRSKYADLASVMEAVRAPLQSHGLEFVQTIRDGAVITVVMHESGESMELAPFPIVATKLDAQGHGSALTYARRYSLQTALGVPAEDDDGNAASGTDKKFASPVKSAQEGVTYTKEQHARVQKIADALIGHVQAEAQGEDRSYNIKEELEGVADSDEKLLLWDKLSAHSGVRARIKAAAKAAA